MGILSSLFASPADRRLAAISRELFQDAPQPSAALARSGPARTPSIDWMRDQPEPPPGRFAHQPGYSDHTYQQFSAPLAFDGFDLDRVRQTVASHRLGYFYESSAMMVAIMGFAPVLAALEQAVAPIQALPRHIHGGDKGLARLVAGEVESMLVPRTGLLPSPYFPPTLVGTAAINLRMMGFQVLQHIDGEPDPETSVRTRFTRTWPAWAVNIYRSPRKVIALTSEGPVEVRNDGKFTLVANEEEPHLTAAICALGEETVGGKLTQAARNQWLDFFASPKLVGTMPEKVATRNEGGNAFLAAIETIYGPDGRGVLPHGSKLEAVAIPGEGAGQFKDALLDSIIHIYMVLTGSAGTIGSGGPTGAGPYQPQKGGPWNVRHDLIARPTIAIVRAVNQGIVAPYCDINYGDAIERAKRSGTWKYPVMEIPIPAPDRDERIESEVKRYAALTAQVKAEREAGAVVTQERVNQLAAAFEVRPFMLADADPRVGQIYEYHINNKLVSPDEVRDRIGLPPLPDGAGSLDRLAQERLAGGDKPGALGAQPLPPPSDEKAAEKK